MSNVGREAAVAVVLMILFALGVSGSLHPNQPNELHEVVGMWFSEDVVGSLHPNQPREWHEVLAHEVLV